MSPIEENMTVTGTVKWFDPIKGFGFVVRNDGGSDIFLHADVLRNFRTKSIIEGAFIQLIVINTPRGSHAERILLIAAPKNGPLIPLTEMEDVTADQIAACPVSPARVKWFDETKGFGFANVFGREDDIFIHIDVLRRSGIAELSTGDAVAMRVMPGKSGLMAIEILSWDTKHRR